MTSKPYDKPTLIRYRLERARAILQAALVLIQQGADPMSSINRSYYAMFNAVLALLITIDRGTPGHSGALALFDEQFVKPGTFSREMGKEIHRAFDLCQKADYEDMASVSAVKAIEIYNSAVEFVTAVDEHLSKSS